MNSSLTNFGYREQSKGQLELFEVFGDGAASLPSEVPSHNSSNDWFKLISVLCSRF